MSVDICYTSVYVLNFDVLANVLTDIVLRCFSFRKIFLCWEI